MKDLRAVILKSLINELYSYVANENLILNHRELNNFEVFYTEMPFLF